MLLLAGGAGIRLGADGPKAFVDVAGEPMVLRAARRAASSDHVDSIVVAVPDGSQDRTRDLLSGLGVSVKVVAGGSSRQESALRALEAAGNAETVAVHDAARCLCPSVVFDLVFKALDVVTAAIVATPVSDTLKRVDGTTITDTVDRAGLWAAQTPQAFHTDIYRQAHAAASKSGVVATDDASLVEAIGIEVHVIRVSGPNLKITTPDDLALAEVLVQTEARR